MPLFFIFCFKLLSLSLLAMKKARKTKSVKLGKDKKQWNDLAQLYKSVDQPEIFQNLYQSHVASISVSKGKKSSVS